MASSKESYKQDLVVSIRYKNDLPPPPMGPKLLEIDTGGLQQYLDPGFAASIAKREEPNIEADAEGGMPIDVIGMYGYFEGDEASITAPDVAPPLDPEDELLMLTPDQLKSGGVVTGSNFLRKTQYMTATSAVTNDPTRSLTRVKRDAKPKAVNLPRDDKENVKMAISKSFDLAHPSSKPATTSYEPSSRQDRDAWTKPVHPTNRSLRPLSFHPILPDLDAATIIGQSWNLLRFDKQPLPAVKGHRDNRLDAAFLMANAHPEKTATYDAQKAAYDADPNTVEDPGNAPVIWSLLLPKDQGSTPLIRRITNSRDPDHADPGLYARVADPDENDNNKLKIPFDRVKYYSNAFSQDKEPGRHTRQVVLTMSAKRDGTAAHYYPIGQANRLGLDVANERETWRAAFEAELPDQVLVEARDPSSEELANRYNDREEYDPSYATTYAEIMARAREEIRARGDEIEEPEDVPSQEHENGSEAARQEVSQNGNDVEMGDVSRDQVENDDD